jgi:hypothetical protein
MTEIIPEKETMPKSRRFAHRVISSLKAEPVYAPEQDEMLEALVVEWRV